MRHIATWVLIALAFLALPSIIPGITVASFKTALIVAVLWSIVNLLVKPIISFVLLPINLLTLGLFSFVINALLFWGVAGAAGIFHIGFGVSDFTSALLGSLLISAATFVAHMLLAQD